MSSPGPLLFPDLSYEQRRALNDCLSQLLQQLEALLGPLSWALAGKVQGPPGQLTTIRALVNGLCVDWTGREVERGIVEGVVLTALAERRWEMREMEELLEALGIEVKSLHVRDLMESIHGEFKAGHP